MGFELVSDIAVLIDRQNAIDKGRSDELAACKESHPEIDCDDFIPTVMDGQSHGIKCDNCGCPTVGVESISQGDIVRLCREILSAMKKVSLVHRRIDKICCHERMKLNPNGVVSGVLHFLVDADDSVDDEGATHLGLNSLIALGRVSLDSDTDLVKIDSP